MMVSFAQLNAHPSVKPFIISPTTVLPLPRVRYDMSDRWWDDTLTVAKNKEKPRKYVNVTFKNISLQYLFFKSHCASLGHPT
jgi:hypothetical protein